MYINDKILDFEYYTNKLPSYLRNSESFQSHFRIWYDLLIENKNNPQGIIGTSEKLFRLLDIFNKNDYPYDYSTFLLDNIGNLFGIKRKFIYDGTEYELNNNDYLIYITCKIIKNNFNGSRRQLLDYYSNCGLYLIFQNNEDYQANTIVHLINYSNISNNLKKLFLTGKITVESMGITYSYENIAIVYAEFDKEDYGWNNGLWS